MSAFLGPIHHWLFNKIKLFEALEATINQKAIAAYGSEAASIIQQTQGEFGIPLPERALEDLIDTNQIHGWLQHKIQTAETRQAATLHRLIQHFGDDVIAMAMEDFRQQGASLGKELHQQENLTAPDLYQQLNNYVLDGMPCDHVNNVILSEDDRLHWKTTRCLHRPYWESAGMDTDTMYRLRGQWIKSFIQEACPTMTYRFERDTDSNMILHRIESC